MSSLLILGYGQFGTMVKEIAEETNCFEKIASLDDNNPLAIGKISKYADFFCEYDSAIVAIGNPEIRSFYYEKLVEVGYIIPNIISKSAYVSPTATLGRGVVIEPMSTVQTGAKIGDGSIVSSGAVVRHNAKVGSFCHIDCGAVVHSAAFVEDNTKIEALSTFF